MHCLLSKTLDSGVKVNVPHMNYSLLLISVSCSCPFDWHVLPPSLGPFFQDILYLLPWDIYQFTKK